MDEQAFDALLERYRWQFGVEDPQVLDWTGTMRVRPRITDAPVRDVRPDAPARNTVVFGPAGVQLAHRDGSVPIVVLGPGPSEQRLAEARRVARDLVVVWGADGTPTPQWRRTPAPHGAPEVSLVVHTADAPERLHGCLRAIAGTTPATAAIELLVVDAGVRDASAVVLAGGGPERAARYVRADPPQGRVAALNVAADAARGELLVFVGDHTVVHPGWLRPLVRALREDPGAGVAGGRLLAADGTVEAAGGTLFADGSTLGFGCGGTDPHDPLLGYGRETPYVSADLLATRTGLLRRLGGMDTLIGEARADVDYCLRVRGAGRRVLYQPQTVATARARPADEELDGTGDGRRRFGRRWAAALAALPERPAHVDAATWVRLARNSAA